MKFRNRFSLLVFLLICLNCWGGEEENQLANAMAKFQLPLNISSQVSNGVSLTGFLSSIKSKSYLLYQSILGVEVEKVDGVDECSPKAVARDVIRGYQNSLLTKAKETAKPVLFSFVLSGLFSRGFCWDWGEADDQAGASSVSDTGSIISSRSWWYSNLNYFLLEWPAYLSESFYQWAPWFWNWWNEYGVPQLMAFESLLLIPVVAFSFVWVIKRIFYFKFYRKSVAGPSGFEHAGSKKAHKY